MKPKALLSWSSGKDSAFALHEVRCAGELEIAGLLTTVNQEFERVAMHAVRVELLRRQADAARLPLAIVELPWPCPNDAYEAAMGEALRLARGEGITHVVFGDLFLADIRAYREAQLARLGLVPVFPLWQRDTRVLAHAMIDSGLTARLACVDLRALDRRFAGRAFDRALLAELPPTVDPCGEHGEFHTFVTGGPMFAHPIDVVLGEVVERDGFVFADLQGASSGPAAQPRFDE
jgi:uncharacterized protein (TIGR00290 family)